MASVFEAALSLLRSLSDPLVEDVRSTLDPAYQLDFLLEAGDWMWCSQWSTSDGLTEASVPEALFDQEFSEAVVTLTREILGFDFDHVLAPWPLCPVHRDHPMEVARRDAGPSWICSRTGKALVLLGSLHKGL
jgi:hypothetical protein